MQLDTILLIIAFAFSVIIHEVSHGYAAYLLGDNTALRAGRLTLNPIPHIDPFGSIILPFILSLSGSPFVIGWAKPVPFNPYNLQPQKWGLPQRMGEAIVAFAGPLSNILLAVIFAILLRAEMFPSLFPFFVYIIIVNLALATFNLVPIPPLDGSKIIFNFFPNSLAGIRNFFEKYSLAILIFFVIFLWDYVAPLIAIEFHFLTGISF